MKKTLIASFIVLGAIFLSSCSDEFDTAEVKIENHDIQATDGNNEGDPDGGDGGYGSGTKVGG